MNTDHEHPTGTTTHIMRRYISNALIVCAFCGLMYLGVRFFLDRQWGVAFFLVALALMIIPFADRSSGFRERLGVSLIVPFALGGLALFIVLYIQMFRFQWFEAIFNDKGSGPFGILVFACLGFATGGYVGFRILRRGGLFSDTNSDPPAG